MTELPAQEFVNLLRKGRAWLLTEDVTGDRLILHVRNDEEEENDGEMFWGPRAEVMSELAYQMFLLEVIRIVKHKGA
jgi:hypothetical protein